MSADHLTGFLYRLDRTLAARALAAVQDHALLDRFLSARDEAAFRMLVSRHGPMVYRVCRRVLPDEQNTEDAFQVTFVVLLRKAASIRKHVSLASWLHGVAYRVALRTRTSSLRRRARESNAASRIEPSLAEESSWREVRAILDEELMGIPEAFRAPLILCYLEGLTQDEAAERLELSPRTLRRYLERARRLLETRLVRRGLTPSAAMLAMMAAECLEAVPLQLAVWTGKLGQNARTSVAVTKLADEAIRAMSSSHMSLKWIAVAVVGIGVGNAAFGTLFFEGVSNPQSIARAIEKEMPAIERTAEPLVKPKEEKPLGRITRRLPNGIVEIDLGSDDLVQACSSFVVLPQDYREKGRESRMRLVRVPDGNGAHKMVERFVEKGGIEVIEVLEPKLARCRISSESEPIRDAIGTGDLLYKWSVAPEIVLAWEKSGAEYGRISRDEFGNFTFQSQPQRDGDLPAFKIGKNVKLSELPAPDVPFGLFCLRMSDSGVKDLMEFRLLRSLELNSTEVTDAGLKVLAALPGLHALELSNTEVTEAGLKSLKESKQLQTLGLANTRVTDDAMKQIAEFEQLQTLNLADADVTDAGLKELAKLKHLRAVTLNSLKVTGVGVKELARIANLQSLGLGDTDVTDEGLKELAPLQRLQTLILSRAEKVTDAGMKHLATLRQLHWLDLDDTKVTDAGLKELAVLEQLRGLSLSNLNVTDVGVKELAALKRLQMVDLEGTEVTDAGIRALVSLKELQRLGLNNAKKVTDIGVRELAVLDRLQWLDIGGTQATDDGVRSLAALKQLQSLDLGSTQITDVAIRELAALQQLQTLRLDHTRLSDAAAKAFVAFKELESLDLSSTNISDATVKKLVALTKLQRLKLRSTRVSDAGLRELFILKSLRYLDLHNTKLTDACAEEFRKELPHCKLFR